MPFSSTLISWRLLKRRVQNQLVRTALENSLKNVSYDNFDCQNIGLEEIENLQKYPILCQTSILQTWHQKVVKNVWCMENILLIKNTWFSRWIAKSSLSNETKKWGEFQILMQKKLKEWDIFREIFTVVREEGHHFNGLFCAFLTKAEQNWRSNWNCHGWSKCPRQNLSLLSKSAKSIDKKPRRQGQQPKKKKL